MSDLPHSLRSLRNIAQLLAESEWQGIKGVAEINSGRSGKTAVILVGTHGNEPVGLAAIRYLLSDLILETGKLYFVLANPQAIQNYFDAKDAPAREACRYVKKNLNRLPEKAELTQSDCYEFNRAAELLPLLEQADAVLDLHSTSSDAPPMLITVDDSASCLTQDPLFPFSNIVSGIHNHLCGQFLIQLAESASLRVLAECGQHEALASHQRAIDISLCFLHQLGMASVNEKAEMHCVDIQSYQVQEAVFVPKECGDFRLRQTIQPFEWLEKGRVIACNGTDKEVIIPRDGYAIMCPNTTKTLDCSEALLFLCSER